MNQINGGGGGLLRMKISNLKCTGIIFVECMYLRNPSTTGKMRHKVNF